MRKKVFSISISRSKASAKPSIRAYLAPFSPSDENPFILVASCFNPTPLLIRKGEVQPSMRLEAPYLECECQLPKSR